MSDSQDKYNNSLERYYSLKHKYEQYVSDTKKKILSPIDSDGKKIKLTLDEKKKLLSKQQLKCINCKQLGGTIFENKNNKLKALCGNTTKPCSLNIEIDKGKLSYVPDNLYNLDDKIKNLKLSITFLKLDFLFNYVNEDESVKKFNKIKDELNDLYNEYNKTLELYFFVTNNNETNDNIKSKQIEQYNHIENFKELSNKYNNTKDIIYLKEAVELYITKISVMDKIIFDLKNKSNYIDIINYLNNDNLIIDQNVKILNQLKYTIDELEIITDNKIINNK